MIQIGTTIKVMDNSGAKTVYCIRFKTNFKKRYAKMGDILVVVVKSLRTKRRVYSKVERGQIVKAVVIRQKKNLNSKCGDTFNFLTNNVILINNNYKLLGTRIFGSIPSQIRYTRFMKLISLSAGLC